MIFIFANPAFNPFLLHGFFEHIVYESGGFLPFAVYIVSIGAKCIEVFSMPANLPDQPGRTVLFTIKKPGDTMAVCLQAREIMSLLPAIYSRACVFDDNSSCLLYTSFVFTGIKGSQMKQVGNAVPPKLATAIAKQIMKDIKEDLENE